MTRKYTYSLFIEMLAIYLITIPLDFIPFFLGSVPKFMVIFPVVGFVLEFNRMKLNRYAYPALIYLLVAFLSLSYSVDIRLGFSRIISIGLNTAVVFLFAMREYKKEEVGLLCKAVAWSGLLVIIFSVLIGDVTFYEGRMTIAFYGTKQDPNELCGYFIFPICYFLWSFIHQKKGMGLLLSVSMFTFLILTGSRGGLLAVIGAMITLIVCSINRKTIKPMFLIFAGCLITGMILWNFLPENIRERLSISAMLDDGGSGRLTIWKNILINYKDSDAFRQLFGYGIATIKNFTDGGSVGHNVFLESMIEVGIVGALLIYAMYAYFGIKAFKLKKKYLFATFCGYMIMTLTLSLTNYKPLWNIILLIIIIYCQQKQEEKKVKSNNFLTSDVITPIN